MNEIDIKLLGIKYYQKLSKQSLLLSIVSLVLALIFFQKTLECNSYVYFGLTSSCVLCLCIEFEKFIKASSELIKLVYGEEE